MYRQDYVGAVAILEEALSNFDTDSANLLAIGECLQ